LRTAVLYAAVNAQQPRRSNVDSCPPLEAESLRLSDCCGKDWCVRSTTAWVPTDPGATGSSWS